MLKHYILRFTLSCANLFPFRAVAFLDEVSARLILERDGAVYRFHHILLRDFFANLTDEQITALARKVDRQVNR